MNISFGKLEQALNFMRILSTKEMNVRDAITVKNNRIKLEDALKGFTEQGKELIAKHGGTISQMDGSIKFGTDDGHKNFWSEYAQAREGTVDCPVFKLLPLEALNNVAISSQGLEILQEIGIIESGDVV
jgi:hypothetical protein